MGAQWRDGGRRLTGSSPEFVDGGLGLDGGYQRVQLDVADSGSISSFTAVAWFDGTIFPNSSSVPTITVLSLQCTWGIEDKGVRTARLGRAS